MTVLTAFMQWCGQNIIIPGVAIINGTNSTPEPPGPSCHLPAPPPPGNRFLEYVEDHSVAALLVTFMILISVGIILGLYYMRWRRALEEQLEMGYIDQEQFDRLK